MPRFPLVILALIVAACTTLATPGWAQQGGGRSVQPLLPEARDSAKPTEKPKSKDKPAPKATAVPEDMAPTATPDSPPVATPGGPQSLVQWFGHAFIYITSSQGVRVALDPFGDQTVNYKFPEHLPADIALITCLEEDHENTLRLFLNGSAYRGSMGVGPNKSNGLIFKGTETFRGTSRGSGTNTVYSFSLDGVRFCHLGLIGHKPDFKQRQEIGQVDVLFLPVGNTGLAIGDLNGIAKDLGAKIIVPINYKTKYTGGLQLRTLDEYTQTAPPFPIRQIPNPQFTVSPKSLPSTPTLYILTLPPQA